MIISATHFCCIEDLVEVPRKKTGQWTRSRVTVTADTLASLTFACYIGAVGLNQLFDKIYKRCKRCGRGHWRLLNIRCTESGSGSLPSGADSTSSDDLSTAKGPEYPVVGSAAWRRPLIVHLEYRLALAKSLMQTDSDHGDESSHARLDDTATDSNEDCASEQVTDVGDSDTQAPSTNNDPEGDAAGAKKPVSSLMRLLGLFIWHAILFPPDIIHALYAFEDESGFREAELRLAQREGTAGDQSATTTNHAEQPKAAAAIEPHFSVHHRLGTMLRRYLQSYCYVMYKAIYAVLKQTAKLIVRSVMVIANLELYVFEWIAWKVMRYNPPKLLMMAFGFVNFVTLVSCYLIFFDSTGTTAPRWAYVFG
jgi:hypothetical protein